LDARVSERKHIKTLIRSERFREEIMTAKKSIYSSQLLLLEQADTLAWHAGRSGKEYDTGWLDSWQLHAQKTIVSPVYEALYVEHVQQVKYGFLQLGMKPRTF
jgi:hypothetical protein